MKVTRPLIRYHGGKFRLASWLIQFFPNHKIYCEPFGGAASVLLQKHRSYAEVYNDLDDDVVNLFRVLQDDKKSARLIQLLEITLFARSEFELAFTYTDCEIERARRTIIRAQMGFGSSGATKGTTGFRSDTSRRYTTAQMDWVKYPPILRPIIDRLVGVLVENRPALNVIENHDTPETLFYVDPPYMHNTRVMDNNNHYYRHEMTEQDHIALLDKLKNVEGMVVLNGYQSDLYDDALMNLASGNWQKHSTKSRASAYRGTSIRTEVVWLNPACVDALGASLGLFQELQA
ncbi:DNA methyltransferase [Methylotenera oryzisoli]|uniref:DNA methyltransferase n=1 Tax=Methylotenera oryzisoli TaxID=2080758 RepID=A0A4Y9VR48_9PROT|nr:DNA adenine methylase [Methylotenera oryzisoli]TFW71485.1 DNA methyltransferase [Methylotenera oryzisoli]